MPLKVTFRVNGMRFSHPFDFYYCQILSKIVIFCQILSNFVKNCINLQMNQAYPTKSNPNHKQKMLDFSTRKNKENARNLWILLNS